MTDQPVYQMRSLKAKRRIRRDLEAWAAQSGKRITGRQWKKWRKEQIRRLRAEAMDDVMQVLPDAR